MYFKNIGFVQQVMEKLISDEGELTTRSSQPLLERLLRCIQFLQSTCVWQVMAHFCKPMRRTFIACGCTFLRGQFGKQHPRGQRRETNIVERGFAHFLVAFILSSVLKGAVICKTYNLPLKNKNPGRLKWSIGWSMCFLRCSILYPCSRISANKMVWGTPFAHRTTGSLSPAQASPSEVKSIVNVSREHVILLLHVCWYFTCFSVFCVWGVPCR